MEIAVPVPIPAGRWGCARSTFYRNSRIAPILRSSWVIGEYSPKQEFARRLSKGFFALLREPSGRLGARRPLGARCTQFRRGPGALGGWVCIALSHVPSPLEIVYPPLHPGMVVILPF